MPISAGGKILHHESAAYLGTAPTLSWYHRRMSDYIHWLRQRVGHDPVFVNATCAIILDDAGKVLLQRRGQAEKSGSWSLPGGVMEIGERPQETIVREVLEETGLEVDVEKFLGVYTSPELVIYPNTDTCQMVTQVFLCSSRGGLLRSDGDETLELKYFAKEDRPRMFRVHLERALCDFENGRCGVSD